MAVNRYYSNTAVSTTLSSGINNAVTSMTVGSVSGFPVSFPYTLVIDKATASEELVTVTSAAGTTLTVTRGSDSTTATTHSAGAAVEHVASARDFREPQEHMDSTVAHGATGAVMGTTNTQTVTNKNMTSETNLMPNSVAPSGSMAPYAGSAAPTGWLLCDGAAVSRTTYAALFAVTGTQFGAGDGSTTFNLPNLKGRVPVGIDAAQTEFDVRGETGGAKTHTLTLAETPSHGHSVSVNNNGSHQHSTIKQQFSNAGSNMQDGALHGQWSPDFGTYYLNSPDSANGDHGHSVNQSNAGSGGAHNNLQPYISLHWIIKT